MKNKNIILIVAIVAIVGGFFLFNSFLKEDIISEDIETNEDIIVLEEVESSIFVPMQVSDSLVFVEKVVLQDDGYVVIYKGKDGKPSIVTGVSEFIPSGVKENFQIELNNPTISGDTMYAILHIDNGDEVFDIAIDNPAIGLDGNVVFSKFVIVDDGEFDNIEKL